MKKSFIAKILVVCMMLSVVTTTAFAANKSDNPYQIDEDTVVPEVTKPTNEDNKVEASIPVEMGKDQEQVTVPDGAINKLVAEAEKALEAAMKDAGENAEKPAVEVAIKVEAPKAEGTTQATVGITLSTKSVEKVATAEAALKVDTGSTTISIPSAALTEINKVATEKKAENVRVEVKQEKTDSGVEGVAISIKLSETETVGKLDTKVPVTIPVKENLDVTPGTVVMITDKKTGEKKPYVRSSLKKGDTSVDAMIASGDVVLTVEDASIKFDDKQKWADSSIDFVSSRGIFNGAEKNKFDGDGKITTAQLFTVLFRLEDQPKTEAVEGLSKNNSWFAESAGWAKKAGLITDVDDSTGTNVLDRMSLTMMLWKYATQAGLDMDIDENIYFPPEIANMSGENQQAMKWAYQHDIIKGTSNGIDAKATTTRAQTATMIERMFKLF